MDLPSAATPVENGRSKRKRTKSTKLKDFVDPMKKYQRKTNSTRRRIAAKNAPENPEDIITPVNSSFSYPPPSNEMVAKRRGSAVKNTTPVESLCLIPLRLALKKDLSLENATPRKRITRNMTASNAPWIVRLETIATPEPTLVTDVYSGKNVNKKKFTEPWNTGAHDDEDEEGDAVNKKEVPNNSSWLKVKDNGRSKSLKVLIPKKALKETPAVSGKIQRKAGRPRERPRNGLLSSDTGVSKRGANSKWSSSPTRQALPGIFHLTSEYGVLPNTVNMLNGAVVPDGERQRKRRRPRNHYGSRKRTERHQPPLERIPVESDASTAIESEEVVAQRIKAMKYPLPPAQQEQIDGMQVRISRLEAHVQRLNKNQTTPSPRDEILRTSEPTKSIARLKVATDMVFMAMREVVDDTDYNPVKMAEVIKDVWPHDDDKNEPDHLEKEGIRSAVRGLLWDRQARGVYAHKKRKEHIENLARRNSAEMPIADTVPPAVQGNDPNPTTGKSTGHSTQGGANN